MVIQWVFIVMMDNFTRKERALHSSFGNNASAHADFAIYRNKCTKICGHGFSGFRKRIAIFAEFLVMRPAIAKREVFT